MTESSFFNPVNRTFWKRAIFKSPIQSTVIFIVVTGVIALGSTGLYLLYHHHLLVFLIPAVIIFLLNIPIFLMLYGRVYIDTENTINIIRDARNHFESIPIQGIVTSKKGEKGNNIFNYGIKIGTDKVYYVDKTFYSLIAVGQKVSFEAAKNSGLVTRYTETKSK